MEDCTCVMSSLEMESQVFPLQRLFVKMEMVQKTGARLMAVECITCQESFESIGQEKGVVVTDLVDLVHKNLKW